MESLFDHSADPPVLFRGQSYSSPKLFRTGTHRTRTPEQTLAVASSFFHQAGMTRLADITGLDCIGIPTILALRPNGKSLSVSAGKGVSVAAAKTSAAMEAIELNQAEYFLLPSVRASWREMAERSCVIPAELLPLSRNSLFSLDWSYRWCMGWDIVAQREVATPQYIVNMDRANGQIRELGAFQINSNGLASGNNFLEALTSSLLEVIERDAVTLTRLPWEQGRGAPPLVRNDSITDPLLRELLDRIKAARADILLFDCRVDTQVPVFVAVLRDLEDPNIGLYRGGGAHLDPVVAASRAITEAVQSRAVYIAGSRDDLFKQGHFRLRNLDPQLVIDNLTRNSSTIDWPFDGSEATDSFEGDVRVILGKLAKVGLSSVIVHDLTGPDCPVTVLKTVIPGIEGYYNDWYAPGPRAREWMR